MSADHQSSNTLRAPYRVGLAQSLSKPEQQTIASLLRLLPTVYIDDIQLNSNTVDTLPNVYIKSMVDGRGLACPMPLLKTKVALRNVAIGESLYVVATDPNSQADLTAFCQQTLQADTANPLLLIVSQATYPTTSQSSDNNKLTTPFDTIYHFIITKTDSN